MQPGSVVNWIASLQFDEAFILLVVPISIFAGIGALLLRIFFGGLIGTASTVGTTKAGIAAEIYAVVLGFVILFGFEHFNDTRRAVLVEASLLDRLRSEAEYLPEIGPDLEVAIDEYVSRVLTEEWPLQQAGTSEQLIAGGITELERTIRDLSSSLSNYDRDRLLDLVQSITEYRATRLSATPDPAVATAIFHMLVVGLILSIVTGWFVRGPSIVIHMSLSLLVAGSVVMLMVLSAQLTYPFTGPVSISQDAFLASTSAYVR